MNRRLFAAVIIAALLLSGCAAQTVQPTGGTIVPPPIVRFEGIDEYIALAQSVELSSYELTEFLEVNNGYIINGLESRDDVEEFLDEISGLSLPYTEGAELRYLTYNCESQNGGIAFKTDDDFRYTINYDLSGSIPLTGIGTGSPSSQLEFIAADNLENLAFDPSVSVSDSLRYIVPSDGLILYLNVWGLTRAEADAALSSCELTTLAELAAAEGGGGDEIAP